MFKINHVSPFKGKEHPKAQPICQYLEDGTLYRCFSSGVVAQEVTWVNRFHIYEVIWGKRSKAGGFIWKRHPELKGKV